MLHALSRFFTALVKRYLPDAYLFVILLTFVTFIAAWIVTSSGVIDLINAWGKGFSSLLMFTLQSALIHTTGSALASTKAVRRLLDAIRNIPHSPSRRRSSSSMSPLWVPCSTGASASWWAPSPPVKRRGASPTWTTVSPWRPAIPALWCGMAAFPRRSRPTSPRQAACSPRHWRQRACRIS